MAALGEETTAAEEPVLKLVGCAPGAPGVPGAPGEPAAPLAGGAVTRVARKWGTAPHPLGARGRRSSRAEASRASAGDAEAGCPAAAAPTPSDGSSREARERESGARASGCDAGGGLGGGSWGRRMSFRGRSPSLRRESSGKADVSLSLFSTAVDLSFIDALQHRLALAQRQNRAHEHELHQMIKTDLRMSSNI